ncbi:MAG: permease, partial [Rhodobacteraceae bacterium]|nr:permease [Paracoccaceae bacterium]
FVSEARMQRAIGDTNAKTVAAASFFGFISSSCSFAALATTRSLLAKGAGLVPSLAFLLASTNLVVELGIIIAVFLGWQFVVAEYVGGALLILLMWLVVRATFPTDMLQRVRDRLDAGEEDLPDWKRLIRSREGWVRVARAYFGEWMMVWKDVTVGFTFAGIIAVFVPTAFFETLFPGSGDDPGFLSVLGDALIGPVAAFATFIGSMGNIPLAGVLYGSGVSMAGIMAFIFSDLVVFPVLRVNAQFYGWRFALYIAGVFLVVLVATAVLLHYAFGLTGLMPEGGNAQGEMRPEERFGVDYTLFLNLGFLGLSGAFAWLARSGEHDHGGHDHDHGSGLDRLLKWLALAAYGWLAAGVLLWALA